MEEDPTGHSFRRDLACLLWTGGNPVSMVKSVKKDNWEHNESDSFIIHTVHHILGAATPELTRDTKEPNIMTPEAGPVKFVLGNNVTDAPENLGNLVDIITSHNTSKLLVIA